MSHAKDSITAEEENQIMDALDVWLSKEVAPHVRELEHEDIYPTEIVQQMKEMGLFSLMYAAKHGGLGFSASSYTKVITRLSETWMSLAGVINTHMMLGQLIQRFGTEEQQERFLPRLAQAELHGALCLTEPDAGTDLQGIKTHARREGDAYILNGSKMWVTNGVHGSLYAILTKTDLDAHPAHKGMTMFLAEKGQGFNVDGKLKKLGYRGVESAALSFDDFKLSADRLLGGIEGQGLQHAMGGLELGRINVAARAVGVAKAAMNDAVRYAQERTTFGKPICEHQSIQIKLADMATNVEASRLLVEQAASKYDKGERCDMEAGMAKLFASEAALENATEAMRVHGGYGYSKEFNVERYYRDAPLMCIGEGTNELQRLLIAKQLVKRSPI
ncbi:MAG: acyl-CoA dehydrogenase [Proteobacteria bacterium]|jgi:alkylation response protein AidB-like acyl-CoA dehydrogenase|nr:acyl-CoA dehydrogenase [Pseudomonadota bacterium]MBT6192483.1 acyl-CoA dehydrogenase [Pseudomonadota bacterium]MBT6464570.1 acyl-CoA dehydrogenase [Pseudomonadota bacterium]MBT7247237.1 acyl-CoA dehydrogenase [Pseudomonadota bacterium]MBT7562093.1 acyl-CoA dehydrogenase [Pseudomonadota bacterium]